MAFFSFPSTTPEELSDAIIEVVDAGARIINLSLGLSTSSLITYPKLQEAYDYARQHGTIIVAASGNQGNIGSISLLQNQWIIPVAASDEDGQLRSNVKFWSINRKQRIDGPWHKDNQYLFRWRIH